MRAIGALRVLAGCECGESVPVGFAGVEQRTDPVVTEVGDPERDPVDPILPRTR